MRRAIIVLGGNEEETQKRFKDDLSLYCQNKYSEIITSGVNSFEMIKSYIKNICNKYELSPKIIHEDESISTRKNIENSIQLIGEGNEEIDFVGGSRQVAEMKLQVWRLRRKLKGRKIKFYGTSEMCNKDLPMHLAEVFISSSLALLPSYNGEKIIEYLKGLKSSARKLDKGYAI